LSPFFPLFFAFAFFNLKCEALWQDVVLWVVWFFLVVFALVINNSFTFAVCIHIFLLFLLCSFFSDFSFACVFLLGCTSRWVPPSKEAALALALKASETEAAEESEGKHTSSVSSATASAAGGGAGESKTLPKQAASLTELGFTHTSDVDEWVARINAFVKQEVEDYRQNAEDFIGELFVHYQPEEEEEEEEGEEEADGEKGQQNKRAGAAASSPGAPTFSAANLAAVKQEIKEAVQASIWEGFGGYWHPQPGSRLLQYGTINPLPLFLPPSRAVCVSSSACLSISWCFSPFFSFFSVNLHVAVH
jgi:hypothetical protein